MSLDMLSLIVQASLLVQAVLVLLLVMSVVSWTIIAFKWRDIRRALQDSEAFLEVYHEEDFAAAYTAAQHLDRSPLTLVFLSACGEMTRMAKGLGRSSLSHLNDEQVDTVTKHLAWTASREVERLEYGLPMLATTGSSAPFIGLFGTVVGIIGAFQGIGLAGSASLAVVAPGIAEALIATAAGLLAAIPATIFYNIFAARIDSIASSVELFRGEFASDLGRIGVSTDDAGARALAD